MSHFAYPTALSYDDWDCKFVDAAEDKFIGNSVSKKSDKKTNHEAPPRKIPTVSAFIGDCPSEHERFGLVCVKVDKDCKTDKNKRDCIWLMI